MRRNTACLFLFGSLLSISGMAQTKKDSIQAGRNYGTYIRPDTSGLGHNKK